MPDSVPPKQLPHLVFGGESGGWEVSSLWISMRSISWASFHYASAYAAWKAKAQQTVDNALMRYFIVHLHRLLDPDSSAPRSA
jgi:hypothetical protein